MMSPIAHGGDGGGVGTGAPFTPADGPLPDYVGSPMYGVVAEHGLIVVLLGALVGAYLWARRRAAQGRPPAWFVAYGARPIHERTVAWALAVSAVAHMGALVGHEPSGWSVVYLAGTVIPAAALRRMFGGRRWRRWANVALIGSLLGYAASMGLGDGPDQVASFVKLVEVLGLAALWTSPTAGRISAAVRSGGVVAIMVVVGAASWGGAFAAGDGGHHLGESPPPGVLLPAGEDRPPTPDEQAHADAFYEAVRAGIAPYEDVEAARAAGYVVDAIFGLSAHVENERFASDGRMLDPTRPEVLVYAEGPDGPVLVGALFQMEDIGAPGPAIGGPLTVWHAHDHVCVGPMPPFLQSLVSPFGRCPTLSVAIPVTQEMLHVWTLDGVPERFGDLDERWVADRIHGEAVEANRP